MMTGISSFTRTAVFAATVLSAPMAAQASEAVACYELGKAAAAAQQELTSAAVAFNSRHALCEGEPRYAPTCIKSINARYFEAVAKFDAIVEMQKSEGCKP
jgi:hypothetical protein